MSTPIVWPCPPNWSRPVREQLTWKTNITAAAMSGVSHHAAERRHPRRSFSFELQHAGQARAAAEHLLHTHVGQWWLPIYPDGQTIAAVAAGGVSVACRTAGFDFANGGRAVLVRGDQHELVTVASVGAAAITLSTPTAAAWPAGTRLYPCRLAHLNNDGKHILLTDDKSRRQVSFSIDEQCDWPAQWPPATYRGHAVLDAEPDWSGALEHSLTRRIATVDNQTATPVRFDFAQTTFPTMKHAKKLHGREAQTQWRSLLYALTGRARPVWVPTFASDLLATQTLSGTQIRIAAVGYARLATMPMMHRDVRIELWNGTKLHRRITAATASGDGEVLTLDAALGVSVPAADVRRISLLRLCTLASDNVGIDHITDSDGVAHSSVTFSSIISD